MKSSGLLGMKSVTRRREPFVEDINSIGNGLNIRLTVLVEMRSPTTYVEKMWRERSEVLNRVPQVNINQILRARLAKKVKIGNELKQLVYAD
jgi:hypothetical protein